MSKYIMNAWHDTVCSNIIAKGLFVCMGQCTLIIFGVRLIGWVALKLNDAEIQEKKKSPTSLDL